MNKSVSGTFERLFWKQKLYLRPSLAVEGRGPRREGERIRRLRIRSYAGTRCTFSFLLAYSVFICMFVCFTIY